MNLTKFTPLVICALVLTVASTGCRKRSQNVTPLPGSRAGSVEGPGPGEPLSSTSGSQTGTEGTPLGSPDSHAGWPENAEIFKAYTVYFEFDRSTVRSS